MKTYPQIRQVLPPPFALRAALGQRGRRRYTRYVAPRGLANVRIPPIEHSRPHKSTTKLVPKSPSGPGHETNLLFHIILISASLGGQLSLLTFPCSERVGNVLEAICAPLLDHRPQDAQGRPGDWGVRIRKTGERRRRIMRVGVKIGNQAGDGSAKLRIPGEVNSKATQTQKTPGLI